jgi:A/G-specific adenine glycosylase
MQWYQANRILYPWRRTRDPYKIWLSEILLQQTTIQDLVRPDPDSFVSSWSGIGYYSRARNMIKCALEIVARFGGVFPSDLNSLTNLPGIGPYTAGAIRNICFSDLTPAIDGNIGRVLARITGNRNRVDSRAFKNEIQSAFLRLGQNVPSGDYFQALMELGERVCLPTPDCSACPVRKACYAYRNQAVQQLPRRRQKKKTEGFHWYFLVLSRQEGGNFYVLNPEREFLKEAWIFPDILCKKEMKHPVIRNEYSRIWGIELENLSKGADIHHTVTYRKITGHILHASSYRVRNHKGKWLTADELKNYPTSSITHKILKGL